MFQAWVVKQAAGSKYLEHYVDDFGADRYRVEPFIEERIKSWLIDKFILYDNGIVKSSERNSILERFLLAKRYYDCKYYFVDNLMTAKYTRDTDRDYFRQQSNFAGELTDFAMQEKVHVMLVAHPKKGESGDLNDDVAGLSDITNRASNVFFMKRLDDADREKKKVDYDNVLEITKNRDYGALVEVGFDFKVDSKKYIPVVGRTIESYGWESEL
jgi:twinkle protein